MKLKTKGYSRSCAPSPPPRIVGRTLEDHVSPDREGSSNPADGEAGTAREFVEGASNENTTAQNLIKNRSRALS